MKYLDTAGIKKSFAEHLKKYRDYSDEEAEAATSDFPNRYENCYLTEDYVDNCDIDGVGYEQNCCYCDMSIVGMDVPPFCFYTFYREEDIENNLVGEYKSARKLFQVEDLDMADFPEHIVEQLEETS